MESLGGFLFVGVPIVVLALFVIFGLRRIHRRNQVVLTEAADPAVDVLRYHVPNGQDPAAVLAALEIEGYAATLAPAPELDDVLIPCRSSADRERAHVRAVIAHASIDMEGHPGDHPVVFADEPGGAGPR